MASQEPNAREDAGKTASHGAEADQGALAALLREVQATHFLVWTMNSSGVLSSSKIPVTESAQQVRLANRIINKDLDEAIKMVESASKQFDSAAHRWTSQARQSEDRLRSSRAAARLNEAKSRHNTIRTRIVPVQGLFRRAIQSLKDAGMRRQKQSDTD